MVMVPTKKVLEVGKPAGQRRLITFGEMASVLVLRGAVMLASASPLVAFRVSMLPTALDIRVAPRAPPVVCVSSWYDSGLRLDGAAPTPPASSGAGSDAASQLEDALAAQAAAQAEANAELEEASKADAELEAALENEEAALKEAVEAMDPAYQESLQEAAGATATSQLEDALAAQAAAQAEANAELEEASKADAELEAALENEEAALKEAVEAMDPAYQESLQEAAGAAETEEAAAEAAVAEAEAALAAAEAAVASASQTEAAAAAGSAQAQSTFEERAAARVAARAEARGEAAPAVGVATPPPAAPVAAAPAGAIAKQSTLSPALSTQLAKYELYDPTTLNDDDQTNTLSAMAFGAALLFLLPVFEAGFLTDVAFSALFGGGLAGYAALRKDAVGAITRDVVGDTSNKAVRRSCCKGQIAPATATTGAVSHRPLHARAIALTHAIAQHMPSLTHAITHTCHHSSTRHHLSTCHRTGEGPSTCHANVGLLGTLSPSLLCRECVRVVASYPPFCSLLSLSLSLPLSLCSLLCVHVHVSCRVMWAWV